MIISSGHGYLVLVFLVGVCFLMELGTETLFQDDDYYQREAWPLALALTITGGLSFLVGRKLHARKPRLFNPKTNEEVAHPMRSHSLFFIKLHWWGPILFILAVVALIHRTAGGGA